MIIGLMMGGIAGMQIKQVKTGYVEFPNVSAETVVVPLPDGADPDNVLVLFDPSVHSNDNMTDDTCPRFLSIGSSGVTFYRGPGASQYASLRYSLVEISETVVTITPSYSSLPHQVPELSGLDESKVLVNFMVDSQADASPGYFLGIYALYGYWDEGDFYITNRINNANADYKAYSLQYVEL